MSIPQITSNLTTEHFKINGDGSEVHIKNSYGNPGLLLVHASWCGHCKRFIPTFQSVCKRLNKNGNEFPCVAIEDAELGKDGGKLSEALNIGGFPTLKFFDQNGKIMGDYKGGRDEVDLLQTICKVYHHCIAKH